MYEVGLILMSFIKKFTFGWNLFWWNYHVEWAREHDYRLCRVNPNWREELIRIKE